MHRLIDEFDPLSGVLALELLALITDRTLYFKDIPFYESAVETRMQQNILLVFLFLWDLFGHIEFGHEKQAGLTGEDHLILFVIHGKLLQECPFLLGDILFHEDLHLLPGLIRDGARSFHIICL